jgi:hypothetical protein
MGTFAEDLWMTSHESSLFLDATKLRLPSLEAHSGAAQEVG